MDTEKPIKMVLDSAVIVTNNARKTIDVSMTTLTKAAETIKATNDKFY